MDTITKLMIGGDGARRRVATKREAGDTVLEVEGLTVQDDRGEDAVRDLSLTLAAGEIVGVAGVTGNGQRELTEALAGLRAPSAGTITVGGQEPRRPLVPRLRPGRSRLRPRGPTREPGSPGSETIWRNAIMRRYGADRAHPRAAALAERLPRDGEAGRRGGAAVGRGPRHAGPGALGRARPAPAHRARDGGRLEGPDPRLPDPRPRRLGGGLPAPDDPRRPRPRYRGALRLRGAGRDPRDVRPGPGHVRGRINAEFEGEIDREAVGRAMGGVDPGAEAAATRRRRCARDRSAAQPSRLADRAPRQARAARSATGSARSRSASSSRPPSPCSSPPPTRASSSTGLWNSTFGQPAGFSTCSP